MPITSRDKYFELLNLNRIIIPLISMLMKKQIKNLQSRLQYLNKRNFKFDKFFDLLTIMHLEIYHFRKNIV